MHGARLTAAAFGNSLSAIHHQRSTLFADLARRARLDGVLAVGVIGAGKENAESPAAFHHLTLAARGAGHSGLALCFFDRIFFHKFAFRVIRAGDEAAEAAFALDEFAAIKRAGLVEFFRWRDLGSVFFART